VKFGEKIRQLRQYKDLTQPELAEVMGIEQSYLSKLENNKSLPSNDVLNRILDVFDLNVGDLVDDLDPGARNQLRQLPDVAAYVNRQKQLLIGNRQRWLLVSSLLLSVGVALIYAGYVHMFFADTVYQYRSHGIVLDGEPKEIFRRPQQYVPEAAGRDAGIEFEDSIKARIDEAYMLDREFHGNVFNVRVDGGSRTYYLEAATEVDPWQNKLVVFLGVLMSILGFIGIVLDRKLSQY